MSHRATLVLANPRKSKKDRTGISDLSGSPPSLEVEVAGLMGATFAREVSVDLLKIANGPEGYQRPLESRTVNGIVRNFIPEAFGYLKVGLRADGSMWVVDGQQRLTALRRLGKLTAACDIFRSSGAKHEARIMDVMNTQRTGLSWYSKFRTALVAESSWAVDLSRIFAEFGLAFTSKAEPEWGQVQCIFAMKKTLDRYGAVELRETIRVLETIWKPDSRALHGDFILGMNHFRQLYAQCPAFSEKFFIEKMQKATPLQVVRQYIDVRATRTFKSETIQMARALFTVYNAGKRGKSLVDLFAINGGRLPKVQLREVS